jgi:hypothetical protein
MVGTIGPMVNGTSHLRKSRVIALFGAANIIGGAATGITFAFLGHILLWPSLTLDIKNPAFGTSCVLLSMIEVGLIRARLPQFRKQVPRRWRHWGGCGTGLYGLVLGAGVGTRIVTLTYYALLLGILLGSLRLGLVIGALFGLARAFPICLLSVIRVDRALQFTPMIVGSQDLMQLVNGAVLAALGMLLIRPDANMLSALNR